MRRRSDQDKRGLDQPVVGQQPGPIGQKGGWQYHFVRAVVVGMRRPKPIDGVAPPVEPVVGDLGRKKTIIQTRQSFIVKLIGARWASMANLGANTEALNGLRMNPPRATPNEASMAGRS